MPGGSSPLTRGKSRRRWTLRRSRGLIPAHAGKISRSTASPSTPRAHPRSRGENPSPGKLIGLATGSSPLTRGKLDPEEVPVKVAGLIPAHAGKTPRAARRPPWTSAHPRSRGENAPGMASASWFQGSSPLTRGKRTDAHRGFLAVRLIPAHAGKTYAWQGPPARSAAHPRSRGENRRTRTCVLSPLGSSPLTRGKR